MMYEAPIEHEETKSKLSVDNEELKRGKLYGISYKLKLCCALLYGVIFFLCFIREDFKLEEFIQLPMLL